MCDHRLRACLCIGVTAVGVLASRPCAFADIVKALATAGATEEMLASSEAFSDAFPAREAPYAFIMGMQLYPDELYSLDFATMNFLEFLHGFSAALYLRREEAPLADVLERFLKALAGKHILSGLLRGLR